MVNLKTIFLLANAAHTVFAAATTPKAAALAQSANIPPKLARDVLATSPSPEITCGGDPDDLLLFLRHEAKYHKIERGIRYLQDNLGGCGADGLEWSRISCEHGSGIYVRNTDPTFLTVSCGQFATDAFAIMKKCSGFKRILRPFKGKLVNEKEKYEVYIMAPGEDEWERKFLPKC